MGYFINEDSKGNKLPDIGKCEVLLMDGGEPASATFQPNLICVVENDTFDAAGYIYDEIELDRANDPDDKRVKHWITHPKAKELSHFDR